MVQFQAGDLEKARSNYSRATRVFDAPRYSSTSALDKAAFNSYSEIEWAGQEWAAHQCNDARDHLSRATAILRDAGNPIGQTKDQIDLLGPGITACT